MLKVDCVWIGRLIRGVKLFKRIFYFFCFFLEIFLYGFEIWFVNLDWFVNVN